VEKISQYKKVADNELENQKFLKDSKNFVKNQDWNNAYKFAGKISPDSVYENDKQKVVSQIHADFFKKAVNDSKKAVKENKCTIISGYITQSTSLELSSEKTSQLQNFAKVCKKSTLKASKIKDRTNKHSSSYSNAKKKDNKKSNHSSSGSSHSSSKKKDDKKNNSSSSSDNSNSKTSAATLLTQAKQAYMAGNCSRAVSKAKQAYRMNRSSRAPRYVGLCGCKQKRKSWAKWAINRSSGGTRKLIYKFCKKNGLSL
jgi:hypothetical protein